MSLESFLRFTGICTIISGIASILYVPLVHVFHVDDLGHFTDLFGMALLLLGLVGIYLHQREAIGKSGFIIFVLTFLCLVLYSGHSWVNAFIVNVLEVHAPDLLANPPSLFATGITISIYPFFIALILFGIILAWKGTLPKWAAILLVVVPFIDLIPYGFYFSQPVAGLGFIGLGWALYKS